MNRGFGLDVWGDNYGVFSQVQLERVTSPAPLGLHHVEGHTPQKVFEGASGWCRLKSPSLIMRLAPERLLPWSISFLRLIPSSL